MNIPDKFGGAAIVSSSESIEESVERIKAMMGKTERTEILLNFCHFRENETGLPIDSLINGDYDRYIDVLNMLLHVKNQAFYTGHPVYENEENQHYVPSLSTMVLLSSMNLLNLLTAIKDSLILPESYKDFFQNDIERQKR